MRSSRSPTPTSSSATSSAGPDFGSLAARYDALRPADANWQEVAEAIVEEGESRGPARARRRLRHRPASALLAERGAKVWGIDPSAEMLAEARRRLPRGVGLKQGQAEALPFERRLVRACRPLAERPTSSSASGRSVSSTGAPDRAAGWCWRRFRRIPSGGVGRPASSRRWRRSTGRAFRSRKCSRTSFARQASPRFAPAALPARLGGARRRAREDQEPLHLDALLLPEDEYRDGLARAERELADVTDYPIDWVILRRRADGRSGRSRDGLRLAMPA